MMKRSVFLFTVLILSSSLQLGCASLGKTLKAWINGKDVNSSPADLVTTPRFSEQDNLRVNSDKQFRRMNRQRLEEEAELGEGAGSLWVMEGQGAYLFAQNQMRMVGDLLNVKIEGTPKSQLQTKTKVIRKLLERLDSPMRGLASQGANPQSKPAPEAKTAGAEAQGAGAQPPGAEKAEGTNPAALAAAEPPFEVQSVPTRIVEQLKDGSYRVRGMQPFMIGRREYKVIVTGIVRAEDFDDAGIDSSKLLDPQFDIVSSKRGAAL